MTATIVIIVSSLIGIAWAVANYLWIRTIDLSYPATEPLGLTDNQHYHLVDIGDKISTVPIIPCRELCSS